VAPPKCRIIVDAYPDAAIKRIENLTQISLDLCSKKNYYLTVQQDIILSHPNCQLTVITQIPDRSTIFIFKFLILLVIAPRQLVLTRRIVIDS
jgi:hypothetical protein